MDNELLAQLELLAKESKGVSYNEFTHLLKRLLKEEEDIAFCNKVCDFACNQLGFWEAEWWFSSASAPNNVANTEVEGWQILYQTFFDALVERGPDSCENRLKACEQKYRLSIQWRGE